MTRFITANEERLWAAIEPDTRCNEPKVHERRFGAYLAPFRTEQEAVAALVEAGGTIDALKPPPKPGRIG
ncbi:hypothetical protein [Sphingomonas agri]|uniref:hypothetical protein n=1 Tax=Sphingomonas agri TaxID=1813878 RepID=UPI00311D8B48